MHILNFNQVNPYPESSNTSHMPPPPPPFSLQTSRALFKPTEVYLMLPVSAQGEPLEHGQSIRTVSLKKLAFSLAQESSGASDSSLRVETSQAPPHSHWDFDWFDVYQFFCM